MRPPSIIAEPQHLHIIQNLKSDSTHDKTSITFWISPNTFLSPSIMSRESYTGEVKKERFCQYQKTIDKDLTLIFDKHYQYSSDDQELRQWSNLVACTEIDIPAENVEEARENILPAIDDFLLVVSLASKVRTVCLGWTASDEKHLTTYYRGNYAYPDLKKPRRNHDGLIEIQDFEQFIDTSYASFLSFKNKLAIRNAIYAIVPFKDATIEGIFLQLFAGLETLVLDYRKKIGMEYVLPASEWSTMKRDLKNFIKCYKDLKLTASQRGSMYKKLDELNRISLREPFEAFCDIYDINVVDLWPIFSSSGTAGLVEIRNKLIHGDPLPKRLFPSLIVAREHLRALVERVVVRVLGCDVGLTQVSPQYIKHKTFLIRDMPNAQKNMSDYLFNNLKQ